MKLQSVLLYALPELILLTICTTPSWYRCNLLLAASYQTQICPAVHSFATLQLKIFNGLCLDLSRLCFSRLRYCPSLVLHSTLVLGTADNYAMLLFASYQQAAIQARLTFISTCRSAMTMRTICRSAKLLCIR